MLANHVMKHLVNVVRHINRQKIIEPDTASYVFGPLLKYTGL